MVLVLLNDVVLFCFFFQSEDCIRYYKVTGCHTCSLPILFFFFQAEDGIRDYKVTGVQTCALPIYVFRLPESADPQAQLGRSSKSDRISTTYAGLRVDKQYAQQRFLLDATVTAIR